MVQEHPLNWHNATLLWFTESFSRKASLEPRGEKRDFPPWWEKLQSHIARGANVRKELFIFITLLLQPTGTGILHRGAHLSKQCAGWVGSPSHLFPLDALVQSATCATVRDSHGNGEWQHRYLYSHTVVGSNF